MNASNFILRGRHPYHPQIALGNWPNLGDAIYGVCARDQPAPAASGEHFRGEGPQFVWVLQALEKKDILLIHRRRSSAGSVPGINPKFAILSVGWHVCPFLGKNVSIFLFTCLTYHTQRLIVTKKC